MDMSSRSKYWFPAKSYGWGWGPPVTWQGWAVLVGFFVLLGAGAWSLPEQPSVPCMLAFVAYSFGLSSVLIAICWYKGEPPSWRWGK